MTAVFGAPAAPTPAGPAFSRDRFGRYLLPDPREAFPKTPVPWTRWTTVASTLDDTYNLQKWKMRMVARGMALRPPLVAGAAAVQWPDDQAGKQILDRLADEALTAAGGTDGRELGSALHGFTETADRAWLTDQIGAEEAMLESLPERFAPDVAAYLAEMRRHGFEVVDIERVCILPEVTNRGVSYPGAAGTYDRLVRCPDGKLRILDVKTQKDFYSWLSIAVQLAGYARSTHHLRDDGTWEPFPEVDLAAAIVMHVRPGSGEAKAYVVDIDEGWRALQVAIGVREMRKQAKAWGWPMGEPEQPASPLAALGDAIAAQADALVREVTAGVFCTDDGHAWNCPGPHAPGKLTIREVLVERIKQIGAAGGDRQAALTALWHEQAPRGQWDDGLTELGMQVMQGVS